MSVTSPHETLPLPPVPVLQRDWRLFSAAVFSFGFGFAVYGAVFINFITETLGIHAVQMGGLESTREIPGLLAVAIAAVFARFAEARIASLCLCLSALGVAATGYVHSYAGTGAGDGVLVGVHAPVVYVVVGHSPRAGVGAGRRAAFGADGVGRGGRGGAGVHLRAARRRPCLLPCLF